MSDEQLVRGRIIRLEVKAIKILLYARSKWALRTRTRFTKPTGKWDILDKQQPVSRRRYKELIGNLHKQVRKYAEAYYSQYPGKYSAHARAFGIR